MKDANGIADAPAAAIAILKRSIILAAATQPMATVISGAKICGFCIQLTAA